MKTRVWKIVDAATPGVPGCVETPIYGGIGTLRRCEALFDELTGEATPTQATTGAEGASDSEATLEQAFREGVALNELAGEATPRQANRSKEYEWIEVEEFEPYADVDGRFYLQGAREYTLPYLFLLESQLNGHNGSVTGSDDVPRRTRIPSDVGATSKTIEVVRKKNVKVEVISDAEASRRRAQSAADRNEFAKRQRKEADTNRHRKTPRTAPREKRELSTPAVAEAKTDSRIAFGAKGDCLGLSSRVDAKTPSSAPSSNGKQGVAKASVTVASVATAATDRKPAAKSVDPTLKRDADGRLIVGGGCQGVAPDRLPRKEPVQVEQATDDGSKAVIKVSKPPEDNEIRKPPTVCDASVQVDSDDDASGTKKHRSPSKLRRLAKRAEGRAMDFQSVKDFVETTLVSMAPQDPSVYPVSTFRQRRNWTQRVKLRTL